MNIFPSLEVIDEVVTAQLGKEVRSRSAEIIGVPEDPIWRYSFMTSGSAAEQVYLLEHGGQKVILKVGTNKKLLRDAEVEESVNELKTGTAPQILKKGESSKPSGQVYYWIVQEFVPGEELEEHSKTNPLSENHKIKIAGQLGSLHQTKPNGEPFFGRVLAPSEKRHKNLLGTIGELEKYVARFPCFDTEKIGRMEKALAYLKKRIEGKLIIPCLIHGDLQDRNIMVQDENNLRIIDFGDAAWSTPEMEFAIMFSGRGALKDLENYRDIITLYEEGFGTLDKDILDACFLSYGAFKTARRFGRNSGDPGVWDKIIEPILVRIEQSSVR